MQLHMKKGYIKSNENFEIINIWDCNAYVIKFVCFLSIE